MKALFGGEASSLSATAAAAVEQGRTAAAPTPSAEDLNTLIREAAKDFSEYQRLTAEGKLGEAGQKLEQLKRKLETLAARQK
jgi:hypothetical protein